MKGLIEPKGDFCKKRDQKQKLEVAHNKLLNHGNPKEDQRIRSRFKSLRRDLAGNVLSF